MRLLRSSRNDMIQFEPGQQDPRFDPNNPANSPTFQFTPQKRVVPKPTRDQFPNGFVGTLLFQDAMKAYESDSFNASGENARNDYLNPNQPGNLLIPANQRGQAQLAGLELGKLLTGQNIQQTGGQIQDLLKKQLGLTEQGANNPITSAMQANKAQALSSVNQDMARAGVKGGAAAAGRLQASRKLDRDIAAQAYQQYQDSLGQARQMIGGIAQAQLAPMYQSEQAQLASSQPTYKPENQTLWSFLGL